MDGIDGVDGMDGTRRRYLNGKRIKYAIQVYRSSLTRSLTQFHHLLTSSHRTDHRTDLMTNVTGSRGVEFQNTIGRQAGRGARHQGGLQRRSEAAAQQQNARTSRTGSPPCQSDSETDKFRRRSRDSGEVSDRDRCDPAPSGSADGGGGTRVNGVGRPDETLRAVTTIRMIRGYGKNVATNPNNEPRFGADRAAPLQGADSGRPSRSEPRRVPSDDMYPTDRSSRDSGRHGRESLQPEVDVAPMLRRVPERGYSVQSNVEDPSSRQYNGVKERCR